MCMREIKGKGEPDGCISVGRMQACTLPCKLHKEAAAPARPAVVRLAEAAWNRSSQLNLAGGAGEDVLLGGSNPGQVLVGQARVVGGDAALQPHNNLRRAGARTGGGR